MRLWDNLKKNSVFIIGFVVCCFLFIQFNYSNAYHNNDFEFLTKVFKKKDNQEYLIKSLLKRRSYFVDRFLDRKGLLYTYENEAGIFSYRNEMPGPIQMSTKNFYTPKRVIQEIAINKDDTDAQKSKKIFDFVVNHFEEAIPLYRAAEYMSPISYLNTYQHGQCGVAASLVGTLANYFGLKARIYGLSGHVVASIYHDGAWRVYDAMRPELMHMVNGLPATISEMVELGRQGKVGEFSEIYASTEDNYIQKTNFKDMKEIAWTLRSKERIILYDRLFMTGTDNSYNQTKDLNSKEYSSRAFLKKYEKYSSNYIKEVALDDLKLGLKVKNFAPISGVFIQLPEGFDLGSLSSKDYPELVTVFINVLADMQEMAKDREPVYFNLAKDLWPRAMVKAKVFKDSKLRHDYFDLSLALNHLEPKPSYELDLTSLDRFRSKVRGCKLLIVSQYGNKTAPARQLF